MKSIYVISPDSGLFYTNHGYTDPARFKRIFLQTWKLVPLNHRRSLTCRWRHLQTDYLMHDVDDTGIGETTIFNTRIGESTKSGSEQKSQRLNWPRIEVVQALDALRAPSFQGPTQGPTRGPIQQLNLTCLTDTIACYCPATARGIHPRIAFWAYAVDHMTDQVLSTLIAYALASAFVATEGKVPSKPDWRFMVERAEQWDDAQTDRDSVRQQMATWGFSASLIDTWCQENRAAIESALTM
jgi:hypothetical protein